MKRLYILLITLCALSCSPEKRQHKTKEVNPFHEKAYAYRDKENTDSAFVFFTKAKDVFVQRKDTLGIASCLLNLAIISTDIGDYFGGRELSLNALSYLDKEKKDHYPYLHSNYNNLGIASERLRDYDKAFNFYDLAIQFASDSQTRLLYRNNKATAYQEARQYQNALKIYHQLIKETKSEDNTYHNILANIAITKWRADQNYNLLPELHKVLNTYQSKQNLWGLNYIYAYISDYYHEKDLDSAYSYANKMLVIARKINSPDDQLFALQKLVRSGPIAAKNIYFEQYLKLDDSLQTARNLAKNRFALIKFETEKHKADKLVLQKQNVEKTYQIIIVATFSILTLVIGLFWYKRRKQKMKLESDHKIQENRLQTSKTVHDKVANKIYQVMSEVEYKEELNRTNLLDELEHIYNTSRDISYEIAENSKGKKFSKHLADMFVAYFNSNITLNVEGNFDDIWINVPEESKGEIYIVLQELMTNMKKHSQATKVTVQFVKRDNRIHITYRDNGIGLPKKVIYGNGMRNTETRIKNISGKITFETINEKGLEILISFPTV